MIQEPRPRQREPPHARTPEDMYALVADVTRTPEFSPEIL